MSDLLQTTITISYKEAEFIFAIPGLSDEIKLGMRERNIRQRLDPGGNGSPDGLDWQTLSLVRAAAAFEVLLRRTSADWVYVPDDKTKQPVIDFEKFPKERVSDVVEVYLAFTAKLDGFRSGRPADGQSDGAETLAGQPNSGDQSIQPGAPGA